MQYVYAVMWVVIGLILIFRLRQESRIFILAGAFFLLLGGWWFADAITQIDLFAGVWGAVLRIVSGIVLVILGVWFVRNYMQGKKDAEKQDAAKK